MLRRTSASAVAGTVIALLLAACGGSSSSAVVRPGCNSYCQQAGVPQGVNPPGAIAVKILPSGVVAPLADGTVPIKVACRESSPCRGALVLVLTNSEIPNLGSPVPAGEAKLSEGESGAGTLEVGAHSTRTLGVQLVPFVRRLLRTKGRLAMYVLAETGREYTVSDQAQIMLRSGSRS